MSVPARIPGCSRPGRAKEHGFGDEPEYFAWRHMWRRCGDKSHPQFKNYGARGISVCDRWRDFTAFIADMGRRPSPKHSLDRINNDGGYTPGNCRWATRQQQAENTRSNRWLEFNGERLTQSAWARRLGCSVTIIRHRLANGWSVERTLATPVRYQRPRVRSVPAPTQPTP